MLTATGVRVGGGGGGGGSVGTGVTTGGGGGGSVGTAVGGGALAEIDLTGRMALMLRAGGDLARFEAGWSPAATLSAGIAFY